MARAQSFILLFGFIFVASILGHQEELNSLNSGAIESIIKKHWEKHVNSLDAKKREQLRSAPQENNMIYAKSLNQKCDHDNHAGPIHSNIQKGVEKIFSKMTSEELKAQENPVFQKQSTQFDSIRFTVNNSYYGDGSDPRACYTVGQTVIIGADGSTDPCTETVESNCVYTCTSVDILSPTLQTFFKDNLLPAVLEIFEDIVKVKRVQGNLLLNKLVWDANSGLCTNGIPLGSDLVKGLGTGLPNTDMLVIGAGRPYGTLTVAYALACNFDVTGANYIKGRPLVGHVNFVPRYFQQFLNPNYNEFDFMAAVKVGVHEFTHAMGFSSFFYNSYIDSNGNTYNPSTKLDYITGTNPSGATVGAYISRITTPGVAFIAQSHYDCDEIDGVQLEDAGGSGTAGSHWEMRMVRNEYMAGYINSIMPVSYLTLSLFNDMGWYKADLTKAEFWSWGKDAGCPWVNERCEHSWNIPGYFCSSPQTGGCTGDRLGKGMCNIKTFSSALPAYYQHFGNPNLGGDREGMDYCTYTQHAQYCANDTEVSGSGLNEFFGLSSMCFPVGLSSTTTNNQGCYKYTCNSDTSLSVTVGTETIACPQGGGPVKSTTLNGVIDCPTASFVCRNVLNGIPPSNASGLVVFVGLIVAIVAFML